MIMSHVAILSWFRMLSMPSKVCMHQSFGGGGSIADEAINLAHLLGMLHIVDLIC
jgi:hypothetical protein